MAHLGDNLLSRFYFQY